MSLSDKNIEDIMKKLEEISIKGITAACSDIEMRAKAYAPVGKPRSPKGTSPSRVMLRPTRSFKQTHTGPTVGKWVSGSRNQRATPIRARLEELQARGRIGTLRSVSKRQDYLRSFKIAEGPDKGKSPAVVRQQPGRTGIIGWAAASKEHGHLRDSIHVASVTADGHKVVGVVRAGASYAAAIELGFPHHGGRDKKGVTTQIPPRPFMRKALQEVVPGLRSGKYFRGNG